MAVGALRTASQASTWIKRRCSQLLRLVLLAPRGLEAVLQGYLDDLAELEKEKRSMQKQLGTTVLPVRAAIHNFLTVRVTRWRWCQHNKRSNGGAEKL